MTPEESTGKKKEAICGESTIESAIMRDHASINNDKRTLKGQSKLVCESTIESSFRRNFIRNTVLVSAAAGVGGVLLGKNLIPESSASSKVPDSGCFQVSTCLFVGTKDLCNGNARSVSSCYGIQLGLIRFGSYCPCGATAAIGSQTNCSTYTYHYPCCLSSCFPPGKNPLGLDFYTLYTKRMSITQSGKVGIGTCTPSSTLCVVGCINASGEYGVRGKGTYVGVCATSCNIGVYALGNNIAVRATANKPTTIPLVVCGLGCANLQEWNVGCAPKSVVNKCGWLGLGAVSVPTTLTVGGSVSAKTVTVTKNYRMGASDFAVLADGKLKVTLPPASTATGMIVFVKNTSKSNVTIEALADATETDTIEGASTKLLKKQYDSLQLISNGTNEWFVLGNSICAAFTS